MISKESKIYIAGHDGMVGSSMTRLLKEKGYNNLIYRTIDELDLKDQKAVEDYLTKEKPEYIFLFAARVGGIKANIDHPAEFLYDNLLIESNVIHNAYKISVKKLLFLGSSCIYPRESPQPMKEEYLLTGKLEPTNEGYALAKIAGLKLCEYYNKQYNTNFISLMPSNIYGPRDHFGLPSSHVMPALIYKFHDAKINNRKKITIWGTGRAKREFLFVDDVAEACFYFINKYDLKKLPPFINIGTGEDISIKELAYLIKDIIGYDGRIIFDKTKPDGMPRRVVDIKKAIKSGWKPKVKLNDGIKRTHQWFLENC